MMPVYNNETEKKRHMKMIPKYNNETGNRVESF